MKILVAYDGTLSSKDALKYGLQKVKAEGGELIVLHVFNSRMFFDYEAINAEEITRRESYRYLEDAKRIVKEMGEGVNISFFMIEGDPEKSVIKYAKAKNVDLILASFRYRSILKRAHCPVYIVPKSY